MMEPTQTRARGWPLVILAGSILLLVLIVLLPAMEIFSEQNDETAQSQRELSAYRAQIAAQPRLQAELNTLNQQESSTAALFRGESSSVAAASMQSLVKDMVERHGGQVRSAQKLSASISGGLEKIEVQYELSIPLSSLKAATYELETKTPFLFIDNVDIHPEQYTGGSTGAPRDLHVQWTIHGYRWAETQ